MGFFNPFTGNRYINRFKLMRSICRRAGVPQFGYHTIRHFVASFYQFVELKAV